MGTSLPFARSILVQQFKTVLVVQDANQECSAIASIGSSDFDMELMYQQYIACGYTNIFCTRSCLSAPPRSDLVPKGKMLISFM